MPGNKTEDKPKKQKERCSYCTAELLLPAGFVPKNVEKVTVRRHDEATGSFIMVKTIALLACQYCHEEMFDKAKPRKPRT